MKKKKRALLFSALCVLFAALGGIIAFADNTTPTIPICTNHRYVETVLTEATCTETGRVKRVCSKCSKTVYDNTRPLGHLYKLNEESQPDEGGYMRLKCCYCEECEDFLQTEMESYWSEEYINEAPERTELSESGYLDLDGNGIINAKDYALILKHNNY